MLKIDTRFGKVTGFSHVGCFLGIPVDTPGQPGWPDQTARDVIQADTGTELRLINDHSCQFPTKSWP